MYGKIQKLTTYDLIMLGIFNAALILFFFGTAMILHLFPILWGAMDPIINFVLAPIFLLMLVRVPKIGALTIHGLIIGMVHTAIGWWPGFIAGALGGLLADTLVYLLGGYKRKLVAIGGILTFVTLKTAIFYAPLYLFKYIPWFNDVLTMWPKEYIAKYTFYYALGFLVFTWIGSFMGLMMGQRLLKKFFNNTRLYSATR